MIHRCAITSLPRYLGNVRLRSASCVAPACIAARPPRALTSHNLMKKSEPPHWLGKFDHASVVTPGLFRSLKKRSGQRQRPLHIEHVFRDSGTRVMLRSPEHLGVDDLKVLQGLVAVASDAARLYCDAMQAYEMEPIGEPPDATPARAYCSMPELSRACGYGNSRSGTAYSAIRNCIRRLGQVTISIILKDGRVEYEFEPFLRINQLDETGGNIVDVGFHPRLNAAILAFRKTDRYIKVNLDEARRLTSDACRLLHHRLSFLNEERSEEIKLETLEDYVWPNEDAATSDRAVDLRRGVLAKALFELVVEGRWEVRHASSARHVLVTRPRDERSRHIQGQRGDGFRLGPSASASAQYRSLDSRNITSENAQFRSDEAANGGKKLAQIER